MTSESMHRIFRRQAEVNIMFPSLINSDISGIFFNVHFVIKTNNTTRKIYLHFFTYILPVVFFTIFVIPYSVV